ncbi:MAG: molecular chaperone HtpG [Anaerolineae bacterium]|nr:molecular chaperone HtpG [Anaerolineae bacterium]
METTTVNYTFKAEVKQLLAILAHSLYKERDIFLRELISNASDALTRIQFEMLTNRDVLDADAELAIRLETQTKDNEETDAGDATAPKVLIIRDSGIGMTRADLEKNLGTIAQSGAREFLSKLGSGQLDPGDMIGQFGVGFYSVFMAADEVRVVSRSHQVGESAWAWVSDGSDQFRIEPAEKAERGTEIHITLKNDAAEYADAWKLRQIIKKHSDFVRFPIFVNGEQANQQTSLWRKNASEVTADDYKKFYQQLTYDFEEPLTKIHFASDAPVNVRALLFISNKREKSMISARKEPGVMLYSHNVLIQEYCTDLLPKWLGFVDGVVDSEDIPLNVSRETVQNNRVMKQLAKTIRGRVMRELKGMAEKDADKYNMFWAEFGRALREGIATDQEAKDEVMPLLRYATSQSDGKLLSLDDYIKQMGEGQTELYYVLGDDLKSVAHSPHLDPFKARNLAVMYWVDPLDAYIAPMLNEFQGKKFRNVDDPELELPAKAEDKPEAEHSDNAAGNVSDVDFGILVSRVRQILGDRVTEVRASKVLKDSPMRLVSPKDDFERERGRLNRFFDREYKVPKKMVELNRNHPIIVDLAQTLNDPLGSELVDLSIEQMYDSALVQEGLHPNPADMLPRIQRLMAAALKRG